MRNILKIVNPNFNKKILMTKGQMRKWSYLGYSFDVKAHLCIFNPIWLTLFDSKQNILKQTKSLHRLIFFLYHKARNFLNLIYLKVRLRINFSTLCQFKLESFFVSSAIQMFLIKRLFGYLPTPIHIQRQIHCHIFHHLKLIRLGNFAIFDYRLELPYVPKL
ncbi:hypothetical protein BpHYR1_046932 [Brachionus plicatilis]|uniref:Uncharacterized protein n=1 Tax=Brachionus plicatilis TaxID=10195 RepID=A0A3M7RGB7_BRAPC|nr:hypothetical protein BpHYR1_046932 [Brachionus plicatilis]